MQPSLVLSEYWVVFLNLFVNSIKAEIESFQNVICNHICWIKYGDILYLEVLVALKRAGCFRSVVERRTQLTWSWCTW
jgi:hypothetical protein